MNNIISIVVGLVVIFLAFKFLKGIIKFGLIALLVAAAAYYFFL